MVQKGPRLGGSSRRQQLLTSQNLTTIAFSLSALRRAITHPYVIDKFKTCLKPIAGIGAAIYLVGLTLLVPLGVLAFLVQTISLGSIPYSQILHYGRIWLKETVSLVPFLALVFMRTWIRKPLFKSFIHVLREVNPKVANQIETGRSDTDQSVTKSRHRKLIVKIAILLALEVVLRIARRFPWLGRPAVALSHFVTMKQVLGREKAIGLALFGLVPVLEPWLLHFIQLWRASSVLGQELLSDYISKCIPTSDRTAFLKSHDVDIPLFALPGSLLMLVPIVGPLFFIPVQASAAFFVDRLAGVEARIEPQPAGKIVAENEGPGQTEGRPTLPKSPFPLRKQ